MEGSKRAFFRDLEPTWQMKTGNGALLKNIQHIKNPILLSELRNKNRSEEKETLN